MDLGMGLLHSPGGGVLSYKRGTPIRCRVWGIGYGSWYIQSGITYLIESLYTSVATQVSSVLVAIQVLTWSLSRMLSDTRVYER